MREVQEGKGRDGGGKMKGKVVKAYVCDVSGKVMPNKSNP